MRRSIRQSSSSIVFGDREVNHNLVLIRGNSARFYFIRFNLLCARLF